MNETTATTQATTDAEALALRQLHHVGAAYALIFVLILAYAWRVGAATRKLSERVDELEREGGRSR